MKKFFIIAGIAATGLGIVSCGNAHGDDPGRVYMPDMMYSRAYEAYGYNNVGDYERLHQAGVNYNGLPVAGTMARGDVASYNLPNTDSGYTQAINLKNPLDTATVTGQQMKEAERIYLVNCGICHGSKLDGNGPLWKGGDGPYPAAPRNLLDDYSKKLADGQMYHVITYGKNLMGSYASQVHPDQRWAIIKYIRQKQGGTTGATPADSTAKSGTSAAAAKSNATTATTVTDSTKKAK